MLKTILAIVAGVFVFFGIVYGVGLSMRASANDSNGPRRSATRITSAKPT